MFLRCLTLLALLLPAFSNSCQKNAAIYHFTVGDIQGTVLFDGPLAFTTSPFLISDDDLRRSYDACFRSTSPLSLSQNVVLLDTPSGRILVDPGSRGSQSVPLLADAGMLFENLRAAGISPTSVDHVLLTHAHGDHVNGLLSPDGGPAFPNAKVHIGRREHRFWTTEPLPISEDHPQRDTLVAFAETYLRSIAPYATRLHLVRDGDSPLPGFRFIPTPGHSPGHNAVEVVSKDKRLIISGDAWMSKPDQLQNPEWQVGTESDPKKALQSRIRLLKEAAKSRDLVIAYHEQFPGLGYVTQKGRSSFDWVAAPPQLLAFDVVQKC